MYKHIFVPLDGSEFAETALDHAVALAQKFDAELTALRVVHPMMHFMSEAGQHYDAQVMVENYEYEKGMSQTYLETTRNTLEAGGVKVATKMAEGTPIADRILEAAQEADADLIVMSTHGRSGFRRLLFGSVAEDLLRQSEIPVLLVRNS